MKETIYTIPINDAFDLNCECPLCSIENKLDKENTEAALGAGMMEPDLRIISNEKGYCKAHYKKMASAQSALSLSLVLQSHSELYNELLNKNLKPGGDKKGIFKKESNAVISGKNAVETINKMNCSCFICDKTAETLERYIINILYLWKTNNEFKEKFASQKGFCLPHFAMLLDSAQKNLSDKDFSIFYDVITEMEKKSLAEMYDDITEFTKLFDYRSSKTSSENVKNAIRRTIQKYSGIYDFEE